jgi:molybdenum cofactor guanylyltransferase
MRIQSRIILITLKLNKAVMLGVILCGGNSTRMGTDKGMIKLHANTWAQTAVDKLLCLQLEVVLSVNKIQYTDYLSVFKENQLIKDNDELLVKGPLAGVLSVHVQYPDKDLFVLACDMPLMETGMLKELFSIAAEHTESDAYVFSNEHEPEPLCAIYKANGLSHIADLLKANKLTRHSMKFMLEHIATFTTALQDNQKKYFRNFNAHAELNGL